MNVSEINLKEIKRLGKCFGEQGGSNNIFKTSVKVAARCLNNFRGYPVHAQVPEIHTVGGKASGLLID